MKLLAIDTASECCSVALRIDGKVIERSELTSRGHADLVLPMVAAVLQESGVELSQLNGVAYGRGPGAFTGVRIAVGVAQGLAFGAELLTVGISDLAAVAQRVARPGVDVLVCMDARMAEVYWATFGFDARAGVVVPSSPERVDRPEEVRGGAAAILAGTGFTAYPQLRDLSVNAEIHAGVLPHARDIALLGEHELAAGKGKPPTEAQPVYLRDRVVMTKRM